MQGIVFMIDDYLHHVLVHGVKQNLEEKNSLKLWRIIEKPCLEFSIQFY